MSGSVEQELWNIFTFYTLHGNPLDPEHLRAVVTPGDASDMERAELLFTATATQFVKLARNCQIIGATDVTEADVHVAYTIEVKRKDRAPGAQLMTYNDFLTALMKLSVKVFPRARSIDDAFQQLLMEHILPMASRRAPENVDVFLQNPDVCEIRDYYQDALQAIFSFYATTSNLKQKKLANKEPTRAVRMSTMKDALGYQEFLKFAADFDLSSSVILSTLEIGDIYLSSVRASDGTDSIRKLTFSEFWEALVRCALVAYSKISTATVVDKIRGLFLYMWRTINKNVPRAVAQRRNMSTYAGDLLAGALLFNKRFTAKWAEDGYRDYLSQGSEESETGADVLSRILNKPGSVTSWDAESKRDEVVSPKAAMAAVAALEAESVVSDRSFRGASAPAPRSSVASRRPGSAAAGGP